MTFWIITAAMALCVSALLGLAMLRARPSVEPAEAYDLKVYRDQLAEVDRDLARGVIADADATRIRTEISRRILAADAAMQDTGGSAPAKSRGAQVVAVLVGAALVAGSLLIYRSLGAPGYGDLALADRIEMAEALRTDRPSQEDAEASLPDTPPLNGEFSPDYIALVEQLRETVAQRPGDLQGHQLLAQSEARLGNFADAYRAQQVVLRLKGDDASVEDLTTYADLLILAAGGYVSPEAEGALRLALSKDSTNGTARYYWGLMMSQTGRPDTAFRIWDAQLREGPADAPWIEPISAQIEDMAARAGVNYQLPTIGDGTPRGPSADDIEAARDMTPAERMEMIRGMVGNLSDRLATEGGPPEDWAQLIGALGVLGETDQAAAVLANARAVFADDKTALDLFTRAAERIGLQ